MLAAGLEKFPTRATECKHASFLGVVPVDDIYTCGKAFSISLGDVEGINKIFQNPWALSSLGYDLGQTPIPGKVADSSHRLTAHAVYFYLLLVKSFMT